MIDGYDDELPSVVATSSGRPGRTDQQRSGGVCVVAAFAMVAVASGGSGWGWVVPVVVVRRRSTNGSSSLHNHCAILRLLACNRQLRSTQG